MSTPSPLITSAPYPTVTDLAPVARLADVAPAVLRDAIRQQLQRDHGDDRREEFGDLGNIQDMLRVLGDVVIALRGHADHLGAVNPDLLDGADDLLVS